MPLCPILAIFCSAWKQPLILISFTVACLGPHRHKQEPTLNFCSNHEAQNSCQKHRFQLPEPHWCETQTCGLNSKQIHKGNGFSIPCMQQCISLLGNPQNACPAEEDLLSKKQSLFSSNVSSFLPKHSNHALVSSSSEQ